MPRTVVDYSNTIIYKIVCNDPNITDLYVGHTTNFTNRKYMHKYNTLNEAKDSNMTVYKTIRTNGGWENWSMIEIEKYPCSDANEARKKERHWLETLQAKLNVTIPSRTQKERDEINKEKNKKQHHDYHIKNRDVIIKRVKEHYENNKEQRLQYLKEYREKHKEQEKKYREENKDKINARRKELRAIKKAELSSQ